MVYMHHALRAQIDLDLHFGSSVGKVANLGSFWRTLAEVWCTCQRYKHCNLQPGRRIKQASGRRRSFKVRMLRKACFRSVLLSCFRPKFANFGPSLWQKAPAAIWHCHHQAEPPDQTNHMKDLKDMKKYKWYKHIEAIYRLTARQTWCKWEKSTQMIQTMQRIIQMHLE